MTGGPLTAYERGSVSSGALRKKEFMAGRYEISSKLRARPMTPTTAPTAIDFSISLFITADYSSCPTYQGTGGKFSAAIGGFLCRLSIAPIIKG